MQLMSFGTYNNGLDFDVINKLNKSYKGNRHDKNFIDVVSNTQRIISYREKENNDSRRAHFAFTQGISLFCYPLLDFVFDEFGKFCVDYFDLKTFYSNPGVIEKMNKIYSSLSEYHAYFHKIAKHKDFYRLYRDTCITYINQMYKRQSSVMTYKYKDNGIKSYRMFGRLNTILSTMVYIQSNAEHIADVISKALNSTVIFDKPNLKNEISELSDIMKEIGEPEFINFVYNEGYLECYFKSLSVKNIVNRGLEGTKRSFPSIQINIRKQAIDIFGETNINKN